MPRYEQKTTILKTNYFRDPNEKIKPNDKILSHLLLAFEAPSMMSPDIYAMAIINTLFGGGGSFSAGMSKCFLSILMCFFKVALERECTVVCIEMY